MAQITKVVQAKLAVGSDFSHLYLKGRKPRFLKLKNAAKPATVAAFGLSQDARVIRNLDLETKIDR